MSLAGHLPKLLTKHRILLTCGTGGVGKTSVATALGFAAAQLGRRTLVLTIDPARRLANALGLREFAGEAQRVWPARAGARRRGALDAESPGFAGARSKSSGFAECMMLDAKRTFDRIIERYAPDPATAQSILANPLYQQLSTVIAGSQEYMAMEQLYELQASADYDLIILDTPPAAHALDFFQAPDRMVRALGDSMLRLFAAPALRAGRLGATLMAKGADRLMRLFGRLTGAELIQEIAELVRGTVTLFGGFSDRARVVQALLRDARTGIVLVTLPRADLITDAIGFAQQAHAQQMRIVAVAVNRLWPNFAVNSRNTLRAGGDALLRAMRHHLETCRQHRAAQDDAIAPLRQSLLAEVPWLPIEERLAPLHSPEAFVELVTEWLG